MRRQVCFVATAAYTVEAFLLDHLRALSGPYDVSVALNTKTPGFLDPLGVRVSVLPVRIERKPSPLRDLAALARLTILFRRGRFDAVHSIAPKSGLLAMLAGRLAGVPVRVHSFTGQPWATRMGVARLLFRWADRLLAAAATHVLVDSPSQRDFLVGQGVVPARKARVLASGSICGVDAARYRPDAGWRAEVRSRHGIPESGLLFLFLGRLNRDKGVLDLARAFRQLCARRDDTHLMLVGPDEEGLAPRVLDLCGPHTGRVHFEGYTREPQRYMAAADVFCLPSYREGFGSTIIEAAAAEVPALGSRIYGITDALEDGATGLLCQPGDVEGLAEAMARLAGDPGLRRSLGRRARERALREFSKERVVEAMLKYYQGLSESLENSGRRQRLPRQARARGPRN